MEVTLKEVIGYSGAELSNMPIEALEGIVNRLFARLHTSSHRPVMNEYGSCAVCGWIPRGAQGVGQLRRVVRQAVKRIVQSLPEDE